MSKKDLKESKKRKVDVVDSKKGGKTIIITEEKEISFDDQEEVEQIKKQYLLRLHQIKRQVKKLKVEAEEIQETLKALETPQKTNK